MRNIHSLFTSQEGLSEEDIIDADIQLGKFLDYMGDMYEAFELVKKHVTYAK